MRRAALELLEYIRFSKKYNKFKPYTMIKSRWFRENLVLAKSALTDPSLKDGAVIECGTWKGGMAAALVELGGPARKYYFFDSFEGLPPAEPIDGKSAQEYQANTADPEYFDNCRASIDDLKSALTLTKYPNSQCEIIPGFFEHSFPPFEPPNIALLRLDADWYSSTMLCLRKFWPHVLPGGIILIDDYYTWDGCARAVHEFLAGAEATERVQQGRLGGTAYIQRQFPTGTWRDFMVERRPN
jgi:O-methyltransferase